MEKSVLTSKINLYISVFFIGAFGLVATSTLLRAAQLDDPVTSSLAGALASEKTATLQELAR